MESREQRTARCVTVVQTVRAEGRHGSGERQVKQLPVSADRKQPNVDHGEDYESFHIPMIPPNPRATLLHIAHKLAIFYRYLLLFLFIWQSSTCTPRTPDLGLVFPPLDAIVDEARHVRNLFDRILQQRAIWVILLGVLQHPFQKKLVPSRLTPNIRAIGQARGLRRKRRGCTHEHTGAICIKGDKM